MTLFAHAPDVTPAPATLLGLSDLCFPWAPQRSAHAEEAEAACRERSIEIGILSTQNDVRRFDAFASFGASSYPTATPEHLEVCIDFGAWLWYLDDTYDEDRSFGHQIDLVRVFMQEHLDVLRAGRLPPDHGPLAAFTLDLRARLLAHAPRRGEWMDRFTSSIEDYLFQGSLQAMKNWASGTVPTLGEYLSVREHDSAVHPCLDLVEIVEGTFIPAEIRDGSMVARLRQITARVVAFTNDLFSYEREVVRQGDPNNLVKVLMVHRGLSFEAAVDESVRLINGLVREFIEIERGLSRRRALRGYIEGMKRWMRGNYDWSMRTPRYRSAESPFPELRPSSSPSSRRAPCSYLRLVTGG